MAWSGGTLLCTTAPKGDIAQLSGLVLSDVQPGSFVLLIAAADNYATADGDGNMLYKAQMEKSLANYAEWPMRKAVDFCNANGAAKAGVGVSIWYGTPPIIMNTSNDYVRGFMNGYGTVGAASWAAISFVGRGGIVAGSNSVATDGADPASLTLSGLSSREYLFIHALGAEGPGTDAYTWDAGWTEITGISGTTGGSASSNIHLRVGYKIATATSATVDVTSTTSDRDYAQVIVAFKEGFKRIVTPRSSIRQGGW